MTTVVAIEPCPQLAASEGRVVLTTVNHLNNDVWQLTAASRSGRREQLQPTGSHKFYNETRRDWVSTKEIHAGEVIRGRAGPLTLVNAHPLPGTRRVYNLTVEGEHVYYVSELGLLAHNMDCGPGDFSEGIVLQLRSEEGFDPQAFIRKVNQLDLQIQRGNARSNVPHGVTNNERRRLTRKYRRDVEERINSLFANNPTARQNALDRLDASDIDHVLDLQLSGQNVRRNLKASHSRTNQRLGNQIQVQLPAGRTVPIIGIEVVP